MQDLAEGYAADAFIVTGCPTGPERFKSDLRLAFYSGYNAGLLFAAKAVRETVEESRKEGA